MPDQFNKDWCDERHDNVNREITGIRRKLDWFYIVGIATLLGVLGNLSITLLNGNPNAKESYIVQPMGR